MRNAAPLASEKKSTKVVPRKSFETGPHALVELAPQRVAAAALLLAAPVGRALRVRGARFFLLRERLQIQTKHALPIVRKNNPRHLRLRTWPAA